MRGNDVAETHRELQAQLDELNKRIQAARQEEAAAALEQIRELIVLFGFSPDEVFGRPSRKPKAARSPKFRDPVSGRTWSGRGPRPQWLKGDDAEQYRLDV